MKAYVAMIATRTNSFCQSREIQAHDRAQAEDYAEKWAQRESKAHGMAWYACPARLHDPRMEYADAQRKARQAATMALEVWAHLMANISIATTESPRKEAARAAYCRLAQFTIPDDVRTLAEERLFSVIGPNPA